MYGIYKKQLVKCPYWSEEKEVYSVGKVTKEKGKEETNVLIKYVNIFTFRYGNEKWRGGAYR